MEEEKEETQPTAGDVRKHMWGEVVEKQPGFFSLPTHLSSTYLFSYWLTLSSSQGEKESGKCSSK